MRSFEAYASSHASASESKLGLYRCRDVVLCNWTGRAGANLERVDRSLEVGSSQTMSNETLDQVCHCNLHCLSHTGIKRRKNTSQVTGVIKSLTVFEDLNMAAQKA